MKQLDLTTAVERQHKRGLDRFPPLIVDRCLEDAGDTLTGYIAATYLAGSPLPSEVLTMPRKQFGLRPIVTTSLAGRVIYGAIVSSLEDALLEPTRASGNWDKHQLFGFDNPSDYAVDLDIASYYEYIEHKILQDELILRSSNVAAPQALSGYLCELFGRSRGLPQMQYASDRLADVYLSILDRKLARQGYRTSRYVDDIRVLTDDWEIANSIIEYTAEAARELGLILSTEKTAIHTVSRLIAQEQENESFFDQYFALARDALKNVIFLATGFYDDSEQIEVEPSEKEAVQSAAWKIFNEWWTLFRDKESPSPPMTRFVTSKLSALYDYEHRLPDDLLKDLVFFRPTILDQVARYIIARNSVSDGADDVLSIQALVFMKRQSPWAKLWLLHAAENVMTWPELDLSLATPLDAWIEHQLSDRHELVRAQAAWLRSSAKKLTSGELTRLYVNASPISQAALAACTAKQDNIPTTVSTGKINDSPLNQTAAEWARTPSTPPF